MPPEVLELTQAHDTELGQELTDAIVAAVDTSRYDEIDRLQAVLDTIGLAETFRDELRLAGVPTICNGECWSPYLREVA